MKPELLLFRLRTFQNIFRLMLTIICLIIASGYGTTNGANAGTTKGATVQEMLEQIPQIPQTPDAIEKVARLEAEGEKLFVQRQLDKALAKWQEAYGLSMEVKYPEGEGRALTNMCRIFLERGQHVKAKYLGENAIEVLYGASDKRALGRARVALAQAYFALDNNVWAGEQLDLALKTFRTETGNNSLDTARTLNLAAALLVKYGGIKEAIKFYQEGAAAFLQAGDHIGALTNRVAITGLMIELGWFTAALEEANKSLSLVRTIPDNHTAMVSALCSVATAQYSLGEYVNARKTFEQVLELAQKLSSSQLSEGARANINLGLGHALAATGDIELAKQFLEKSINGFKTAGGTFGQAEALNALGNIEAYQGNDGRAFQLLGQALDMQGLLVPKKEKMQIVVLQNLAVVESRLGRNRDAKAHLETALEILKKFNDAVLRARTCSSLAEVSLRLADMTQAEKIVRQAITFAEKINDDASLWRDYTLLAKIQLDQNQAALVRESLVSAISHFRSPQAAPFPSPERLNFPTTREDMGQQLVNLLVAQGMTEQALLTAEQLKDELFVSEWMRRDSQVKPEDKELYADLVLQKVHLHAAETAATPDKMLKDWQLWQSRWRTVASQNRGLAKMIAPLPITITELAKIIRTSPATIVDFLVGRDSSVVFTIDPSGRISSTILPVGARQLQPQVSQLLSLSAASSVDLARQKELLHQLYNELIPASIRGFIPKSPEQTVVIIPDGVLFNLPFAALLDEQGKYLVESHTMTMVSSLGTFLDSPPRYTDALSLMVASPHTNSPTANDETKSISSIFRPEQVTELLGSETDVIRFKEQAKGKAVVHLATKMLLNEMNPMQSILPLASLQEGGKRITANQLFGMDVANDLVVLSASSVNAKDVQGNAVKLFSRGLNYAGTRNLLMSLWVSPDPQRTAELVEFYKNKHLGLNQAQSLRKAQLLALSKNPSPHSWAAFQLIGPGY